jgi:excinuclease ABC subunit A
LENIRSEELDRPWRNLPRKDRDWILFTDEQPVVPVYAGLTPAQTRQARRRKEEPSYQGTFTSARRYVLQTFAKTHSALIKKRVSNFVESADCPLCRGKRLRREALSVKFAGLDIGDLSRLSLKRLADVLRPYAEGRLRPQHPVSEDKQRVAAQLCQDMLSRITILADLGLATSRWIAARRRCRRASFSGCGWRRKYARGCSASSTFSTSRRRDCIRTTPKHSSPRWQR